MLLIPITHPKSSQEKCSNLVFLLAVVLVDDFLFRVHFTLRPRSRLGFDKSGSTLQHGHAACAACAARAWIGETWQHVAWTRCAPDVPGRDRPSCFLKP